MGHTVLSHILFSTNQIDTDLNLFFSETGDAHSIEKLNRTNLTAQHLIEHPSADHDCVLQIVCSGWDEILRLKMGYHKWMKKTPNITNYRDFFQSTLAINKQQLWQDFYRDIRDPSWPACSDIKSVRNLPGYIQKEVQNNWIEPKLSILSDFELLEYLTISYYDTFVAGPIINHACPHRYELHQYLKGDFSKLIDIADMMQWQWCQSRSTKFYQQMLQGNRPCLSWIDRLKKIYDKTILTSALDWSLELWEMSVLLAKIFTDLGRDPNNVEWQTCNRFYVQKSLNFKDLIGT